MSTSSLLLNACGMRHFGTYRYKFKPKLCYLLVAWLWETSFGSLCLIFLNCKIRIIILASEFLGFPGGTSDEESACNARDPGLIPRLGRSLKRMATHSSISAWEIPWTKKPGGLQSMGSQRVGHDWVVNTFTLDHLRAMCFGEFYLSPISPFVDWRL